MIKNPNKLHGITNYNFKKEVNGRFYAEFSYIVDCDLYTTSNYLFCECTPDYKILRVIKDYGTHYEDNYMEGYLDGLKAKRLKPRKPRKNEFDRDNIRFEEGTIG